MHTIIEYPLKQDCEFVIQQSFVYEQYEKQIAAVWNQRKKQETNENIISVVSYTPEKIVCQLLEYRVWYAAYHDVELQKQIHVYPLCVSGKSVWKNSVLLGRRSQHVTMYPGFLECVPSGTVDWRSVHDNSIDVHHAIMLELEQEARISRTQVQSICTHSIYYSYVDQIWDLYIEITLKDDANVANIIPTYEYDQFFWGVPDMYMRIVPVSKKLLSL